MGEETFELELEVGFRTAMREGFVYTANAFAEMLRHERTGAPFKLDQHHLARSLEKECDQPLENVRSTRFSRELRF